MNAHARGRSSDAPSADAARRAFAAYLSTRPDLLSLATCARFDSAARALEPLGAEIVHALLACELGAAWPDAFDRFDDAPIEVTTATQVHDAVRAGGKRVAVVVPRPWCPPECDGFDDLEAADGAAASRELLRRAVAEYAADWRHASDAAGQAAAWRARAVHDRSSAADSPLVDRLSTRRVLVLDGLDDAPPLQQATGAEILRTTCARWFTDALLGRPFALEPIGRWVIRSADSAHAGATLDALPRACAERMRGYLVCVAAEEPDRACVLLTELFPQITGAAERRLARELRKFVAIRDWKWPGAQAPVPLADCALGHWRAAIAAGGRGTRPLLSFYRALFLIAGSAGLVDGGGEAVAAALQDALVTIGVCRTRHLFTVDGLQTGAVEFATLAAMLPRALDDGLSSATHGRADAAQDEVWLHAERVDLSITMLWSALLLTLARQLAPPAWARLLSPALLVAALGLVAVGVWRTMRPDP